MISPILSGGKDHFGHGLQWSLTVIELRAKIAVVAEKLNGCDVDPNQGSQNNLLRCPFMRDDSLFGLCGNSTGLA